MTPLIDCAYFLLTIYVAFDTIMLHTFVISYFTVYVCFDLINYVRCITKKKKGKEKNIGDFSLCLMFKSKFMFPKVNILISLLG